MNKQSHTETVKSARTELQRVQHPYTDITLFDLCSCYILATVIWSSQILSAGRVLSLCQFFLSVQGIGPLFISSLFFQVLLFLTVVYDGYLKRTTHC